MFFLLFLQDVISCVPKGRFFHFISLNAFNISCLYLHLCSRQDMNQATHFTYEKGSKKSNSFNWNPFFQYLHIVWFYLDSFLTLHPSSGLFPHLPFFCLHTCWSCCIKQTIFVNYLLIAKEKREKKKNFFILLNQINLVCYLECALFLWLSVIFDALVGARFLFDYFLI